MKTTQTITAEMIAEGTRFTIKSGKVYEAGFFVGGPVFTNDGQVFAKVVKDGKRFGAIRTFALDKIVEIV